MGIFIISGVVKIVIIDYFICLDDSNYDILTFLKTNFIGFVYFTSSWCEVHSLLASILASLEHKK